MKLASDKNDVFLAKAALRQLPRISSKDDYNGSHPWNFLFSQMPTLSPAFQLAIFYGSLQAPAVSEVRGHYERLVADIACSVRCDPEKMADQFDPGSFRG